MAAPWYEPYIDGKAWWDAYDWGYDRTEAWDLDKYRVRVEQDLAQFGASLTTMQAVLNRTRSRLLTATDKANWRAHNLTYSRLIAPILADSNHDNTVPAFEGDSVGNLALAAVIVVGVGVTAASFAVGIMGIAWGVARVGDAVVGAKAVTLWEKDLDARRWAAANGKQLQPATLPGTVPDPSRADPSLQLERGGDGDDDSSGLLVGLGLLGLALAAGATWASTRR